MRLTSFQGPPVQGKCEHAEIGCFPKMDVRRHANGGHDIQEGDERGREREKESNGH